MVFSSTSKTDTLKTRSNSLLHLATTSSQQSVQLPVTSPNSSNSNSSNGNSSSHTRLLNGSSITASNRSRFPIYGILCMSVLSLVWLHQDSLMILVSGSSMASLTVSRQQQSTQSYLSMRQQQQQQQQDLLPDLQFTLKAAQLPHSVAAKIKTVFINQPPRISIDSHILPPHRPFCRRSQVIDGEWSPVLLNKPPYVTTTTHLRCYPSQYYGQVPFPSYEWTVSSQAEHGSAESVRADHVYDNTDDVDDCLWSPWSKTDFCQATANQHLLIVGDSLSWEHYASLVQLLGESVHQGFQHQSKAYGVPVGQAVCNGNTKVWYLRDDKLDMLPRLLDEFVPHQIIANRGAHYVNDTMLMGALREDVFPAIKKWQKTCRAEYGGGSSVCSFAWRTSVPGHPDCSDGKQSLYTKPNNHLAEVESMIRRLKNYDNHTINYHWYDYQHQNELVLELLQEMFGDGDGSNGGDRVHDDLDNYMVLDAYYLNVRRPDEHRAHQGDCLHNCYPGKMDVYSRLHLHYLLAKQEQAKRETTTWSSSSKNTRVIVSKNATWWGPTSVSTEYDKQGWMNIIYGDKKKKNGDDLAQETAMALEAL
ncbi:hypothetical protein MPSEU_000753300 [Mayamaea pseudoterrestris]|nr:hypothetical protein MPSEU_000753300 [Mayamaea pseudoterrestris]